MSDPVFEVNYRVGFGNLNAFFGVWLKRTWFDRANWKRFGLYTLGIAVLHIVALHSYLTKPVFNVPMWDYAMQIVMGVALILISAVYAFIAVFLLGALFTYSAQTMVFAFGPMRKRVSHLKANAAGFEKTANEIASRTNWHDVAGVVVTKTTVVLFANRNSATLIPKSAFASPAEAEAFAAFAKAQWEDARSVF